MHTDCWIQQVTTRVGAVTCWIQQSVSPKQVVGFTCVFNSAIDQLMRKFKVPVSSIVLATMMVVGMMKQSHPVRSKISWPSLTMCRCLRNAAACCDALCSMAILMRLATTVSILSLARRNRSYGGGPNCERHSGSEITIVPPSFSTSARFTP